MENGVTAGDGGTGRASTIGSYAATICPMRTILASILALFLATSVAPPAAAGDSGVMESIAAALAAMDPLVVDGVMVDGPRLRALYEGQPGSPLWLDRLDAVNKVLGDAAAEGLDPSAYNAAAIAYRQADRSDAGRAALDLLVSDALLRYVRDVRYGRMRPRLAADIQLDPAPDPVPLVRWLAASPDVEAALRELPPRHPAYRALRTALVEARALVAAGTTWPMVPDGPSVRPGTTDPVVPYLRARLAATGEYNGDVENRSDRYDPALVDAVEQFQETHGLVQDGIVGKRVRAAMNVGPATRVEQIVVNMERWRWLPEDLGSRRVMVNVAGQQVRLVDGDVTRFEAPVIVGETDKKTPIFSSTITHVIFNPSWTVPDKIARRELLPKVLRDGSYFARQGIRPIGQWQPGSSADDPEKPDWAGARGAAGFRLRQAPGPQNPLGRVKFMIPNVFGVYLHDTSNRSLFRREGRTLSHGCVRVGSALEFADEILGAQPSWSPERRQRILKGWKTTTVALDAPVPVHLMYETAWVDGDGRVHYLDDVYGRDRRLAQALAGRGQVAEATAVRIAQP
jgi:murein L,D-transpeptidase YcbB/YkuD